MCSLMSDLAEAYGIDLADEATVRGILNDMKAFGAHLYAEPDTTGPSA